MDDLHELHDPQPPRPGGREIRRGGNYLELEPGQSVEGFLVGKTQIPDKRGNPVERFLLAIDGEPQPVILPSHYDLNEKLREIWQDGAGEASYVWIAFRGKRKVPGVPEPMAFYRVVNYGKGEPGPTTESEEEVPF